MGTSNCIKDKTLINLNIILFCFIFPYLAYQPPPDPYKPLDPNQAYPLESVPQEQQGYASQPPPSYYSEFIC